MNGTLNADLIDVTYGVTLDLKKDLDIATLQIGGGTMGSNTQASAVNVGTGVTLTSTTGVNLGDANGQGALAGNLNINGGTAVLAAASFLDGSDSGITLSGGGTLTMGGDITGTSGTLTLGEGTLNFCRSRPQRRFRQDRHGGYHGGGHHPQRRLHRFRQPSENRYGHSEHRGRQCGLHGYRDACFRNAFLPGHRRWL